MDAKRWQRIDAAFQEIVTLESAERRARLDALRREDPELADELESLIAADAGNAAGAVSRAMGDAARMLAPSTPESPLDGELDSGLVSDLRFGPYQAGALLGAGGMGAVFLGERRSGDFEQRVALKVLRRPLASEGERARFAAERSILAGLQHDRIARLIDGGVADDGCTPWFAMELVEGQPLMAALVGRTLEQRLRVFVEICEAVEFAHKNLVVHRDLKPSNILVDDSGTPKLLDFGIAKVLEGSELGERRGEITQEGERLMTPSYASPEQLSGGVVTTATDIYTLGVLLYQLLTGQHPFSGESRARSPVPGSSASKSPASKSSASKSPASKSPVSKSPVSKSPVPSSSEVPTPPSRRRGAPDLEHWRSVALARDLDHICLTAMRVEPQRRYASVADLRKDIERYLEQRPIEAGPDSLAYRAGKFFERRRFEVLLTAAALAAVLATAGFFGVRLAEQRDRALAESQKASQVSTFLTDLFSAADPSLSLGEEVTVKEMLDRGARRLELELMDQPAIRSDLLFVLGDVHKRLGAYDRAFQLLDESARLNADLGPPRRLERARALQRAGEVRLYEERYDEAESLLGAALELHGVPSAERAETLDLLGRLERLRRRPEAAEQRHQEALDERLSLFGQDSLPVAESWQSLGSLRQSQGKSEEAIELYWRALEIRSERLGADHPETVELQQNLASSMQRAGQLEEALAMMQQALVGATRFYGEHHPAVGWTLSGVAYSLQQVGRLEEAVDHDRRAVAVFRQLGPSPAGVTPLVQLSRHLTELGHLDEAEQAIREALEWLQDSAEQPDPKRSNVLVDLGTVLTGLERFDDAEEALREALRLDIGLFGDDHSYVAQDRYKIGDLMRVAGRSQEALRWLDAALERQRRLAPGANALGRTLISRGEALLDLGRLEESEASFREALDVFAVRTPEGHPDFAVARLGLGAALLAQGAPGDARVWIERATSELHAALGSEHPSSRLASQRLRDLSAQDSSGAESH